MDLGAAVSPQYRRPFRKWDATSWIRSKPLRDGTFDGVPFPPRLVPLASHPDVAGVPGRRARLLACRLLAHLQFTRVLELEHVNPVCAALVRGGGPAPLSDDQRNDALRIYCDEGGHALFVEDLARKVERAFGVDRVRLGRPRFDRALEEISARGAIARSAAALAPEIVRFFFVTVSETLVSRILREIPNDPEVAGVVREVIGDHATDEAVHAMYFQWYFPRLWGALPARQQEAAGRLLPELVWAFLGPDREAEIGMLQGAGVAPERAAALVDAAYDEAEVRATVRRAARPTLRMFERAGVLDAPAVQDAFAERCLIGVDAGAQDEGEGEG